MLPDVNQMAMRTDAAVMGEKQRHGESDLSPNKTGWHQVQLRTLFLLVTCAALFAFGWRLGQGVWEREALRDFLPIFVGLMIVVVIHGGWPVVPLALLGIAVGGGLGVVVPLFLAGNVEFVFEAIYGTLLCGAPLGALFGSIQLAWRDRRTLSKTTPSTRVRAAVSLLCLIASCVVFGIFANVWFQFIRSPW